MCLQFNGNSAKRAWRRSFCRYIPISSALMRLYRPGVSCSRPEGLSIYAKLQGVGLHLFLCSNSTLFGWRDSVLATDILSRFRNTNKRNFTYSICSGKYLRSTTLLKFFHIRDSHHQQAALTDVYPKFFTTTIYRRMLQISRYGIPSFFIRIKIRIFLVSRVQLYLLILAGKTEELLPVLKSAKPASPSTQHLLFQGFPHVPCVACVGGVVWHTSQWACWWDYVCCCSAHCHHTVKPKPLLLWTMCIYEGRKSDTSVAWTLMHFPDQNRQMLIHEKWLAGWKKKKILPPSSGFSPHLTESGSEKELSCLVSPEKGICAWQFSYQKEGCPSR